MVSIIWTLSHIKDFAKILSRKARGSFKKITRFAFANCTVENALTSWKVAWSTEYFILRSLKYPETHETLDLDGFTFENLSEVQYLYYIYFKRTVHYEFLVQQILKKQSAIPLLEFQKNTLSQDALLSSSSKKKKRICLLSDQWIHIPF